MEIIETEIYRWVQINIGIDEHPEDPREWDNLWTMVCSHRNYDLWDTQLENHWEWFLDDLLIHLWINRAELMRDYIYQPLYLLDHSWISMNTGGFWCPWDSWQVWVIYVSRHDARKWFNVKKLDSNRVLRALDSEVKTYSSYIEWDVYMYEINDEYYWGYFSEKEMISDAKDEIDAHIKYKLEKHIDYIKWCIKNKVPEIYRKQFIF